MKKWTKRQARSGGTVEPASVNDEFRAQQSSITTLDREQFDRNWTDDTYLTQYAIHRVYHSPRYPTGDGEQQLQSSNVPVNAFLSVTPPLDVGGWYDVDYGGSEITLDGFKGGNLFVEWSGNAVVFGTFASTTSLEFPLLPRYLGLRILVNSTVLVENRGPFCHEAFRIFGTGQFPPGDLTLRLQLKVTSVGPDDPLVTSNVPAEDVPQAHCYANKYLAIGRFR
jgi:hypothetical protein